MAEPWLGVAVRGSAGRDALHPQLVLFFGAACGLVWLYLLYRSRDRRELLVLGAIAFGGALVLYLPWLPTVLYQVAHTGAPWSEPPTVLSLLGTPGTMLGQFAQVACCWSPAPGSSRC